MSSRGSGDSLFGVKGKDALLLFFLFFPVALSFLGLRLLFPASEQEDVKIAEEKLEVAFSQLEADPEPLEHFSRFFKRLEKSVFEGGGAADPQTGWRKILPILKRRYPGSVEAVWLDSSGKLVKELCDTIPPRQLAARFFQGYQQLLDHRKPLSSIEQSFVKSFLGTMIPTDSDIHSQFLLRTPKPDESYLYFSKPRPIGMFILFFRPKGSLRQLALAEKISWINRTNRGFRLCFALAGEKPSAILPRLDLQDRLTPTFWNNLQRSPRGFIRQENLLVGRRILYPSGWVVGTTEVGDGLARQASVEFGFGLALLAGVLAFLILRRSGRLEQFFTRSIRNKLLGGFLYTALIPLVFMALTSRSFLANRQLVLEAQTHQSIEEVIKTFDQAFRFYLREIESRLYLRYFNPENRQSTLAEFLQQFPEFHKAYKFDSCIVFNKDGAKDYEFSDPEFPNFFGDQFKPLGKVAKEYFSRVDSFAPRPDKAGTKAVQDPTEFPIDLNFPNCQEVNFGNVALFMSQIMIVNKEKQTTHFVVLFWNKARLQGNFIQRELARFNRKAGLGSFYAWCPENPALNFPPDFRAKKLVQTLLPRVSSPSRGYRRSLDQPEGHLLFTGLRGVDLNKFVFANLMPDHLIVAELRQIAWELRFISLVILGACVIIGFLLARFFIEPIRRLNQGMDAISRRDFEVRLPVDSRDEVGMLAKYFNETIENLADLEVARTLQDGFFPQDPLVITPWEVFGACIPARQVGGDYFDYLSLSPTRALILIGDVTGHGVGAALVVAMAKATVGHPATLGHPEAILEALNRIFMKVLERQKSMSALLALVDTQENQVHFCNAGHPYPMLVRQGKATSIEVRGLPIGSVKSWRANSLTLPLQAEDALVFFTDGLVEAHCPNQSPEQGIIGFDRIREDLPGLLTATAKDSVRAIQAWHKNLSLRAVPKDDVSVIVVQGSGGHPAGGEAC